MQANQPGDPTPPRFVTGRFDADTESFPRTSCGKCGETVVFTPDGWQHECAPWFQGGGHQPDIAMTARVVALRYAIEHCPHELDEADQLDRCRWCGCTIVRDQDTLQWVLRPGQTPWLDEPK